MEPKYNYQCGFNAGYILAKYRKAILTRLTASFTKTSEYLIGLTDGKTEYELEMNRGKLDELDRLRDCGDRDLER